MALNELLNELDAAGDSNEDRNRIWAAILQATGKTKAQLSAELAGQVGAHEITVRRWIDGHNVPRASVLKRVRNYLLPNESEFPYIPTDPPVEFPGKGRYSAIWTVEHYLASLQYATCAFVCKGLMRMHAETENEVRNLVERTIAGSSKDLVIYYVVAGKEANDSYEGMIENIRKFGNREILKSVRKVVLTTDHIGVSFTYASPFIVPYKVGDWHRFKREVNILYEVPVDQVNSSGEAVTMTASQSAFVQLPASYARDLWQRWGPGFKDLEYVPADETSPKKVEERHWNFPQPD